MTTDNMTCKTDGWKKQIDLLVEARDLAGLKKLRDRVFGWEKLAYIRNAIKTLKTQ